MNNPILALKNYGYVHRRVKNRIIVSSGLAPIKVTVRGTHHVTKSFFFVRIEINEL